MQPLAAVLPGIAFARPEPEPALRKVRQKDRAGQWRRELERRTGELLAQASTPAARDALTTAYEAEIARGPSFARVRRNARFGDPQVRIPDRNELARLIWQAEQIGRGFWKADRKAARSAGRRIKRTVSRTALDVMKALARLVAKHGRAFPSLEGLAWAAGCCRRTAVRAVKELEGLGLLVIHRRAKRVLTPFGLRQVQDTSIYELVPPRGLAAMALAIFGIKDRASECNNGPARETKTPLSKEEPRVASASPLLPSQIPLPPCTTGGKRIPWQAMLKR
jgi:hypothetical protein